MADDTLKRIRHQYTVGLQSTPSNPDLGLSRRLGQSSGIFEQQDQLPFLERRGFETEAPIKPAIG
jgi:hypothetical protein